jgi:hypothetical protein
MFLLEPRRKSSKRFKNLISGLADLHPLTNKRDYIILGRDVQATEPMQTVYGELSEFLFFRFRSNTYHLHPATRVRMVSGNVTSHHLSKASDEYEPLNSLSPETGLVESLFGFWYLMTLVLKKV